MTVATITCPRCRCDQAATVAASPVPGCWTVHSCPACSYTWRSTEPPEATDPKRFPSAFTIDTDTISTLPEFPAIPARRGDG
ncbi:hypothetical protein OG417_51850 [Actinoallomurus sp. NBC_01490]|uniref:non-oxidative hydroxyarylic acid decarboxylases subunit D n=1 Tax=Actinoallomurus sp. NBC_01490 TaxID=2903557 RepID=UPI002E34C090|nr:non-oxidative hydroxyarylic acid decarboxylases subunit D [Actinoallomurus sp. NBC_01490]